MLIKPSAQRILLLLLLFCLVLPGWVVRAQTQAFASVAAPDFSKFPVITTLLDTFDDQGQFIAGLNQADVVVSENGQQISPDSVQEFQPPLSVVVAINSSPTLAMRDGFGISRYDKMAAVISNWAGARPENSQDDISLTWNGGVVSSHIAPAAWKTRFDGFDPALRNSQSGISALSYALDTTQDAQIVPGQKKVILLVSGHLDNDAQNTLSTLVERAQKIGVRVYVWMADSDAYLTHPGAIALQQLANATGGRYLTFTGGETLPDPEAWFSTFRHVYQLSYHSKARTSGAQTLSVQVNAKGLVLTSPTINFDLKVQPPNPVLLSPPIQIVRQNPDKPFDIESFLPVEQEISALVEFPDGYTRNLKRTTLYVDGQKVAENNVEPFDKFRWDISGYVASGQHTLEVEAEDELGLTRRSVPLPVDIVVVLPPGGMAGLLLQNSTSVTVTLVVLAGIVLLVILFQGGRFRFASLAERRRARARETDPVTQPVAVVVEQPRSATRANPFPWLRRKGSTPSAYLVRLTNDGQPSTSDPIPLGGHEMTFGTDPTQATNILDHLSVSPVHARLRFDEGNGVLLLDQNSVAGTWVNYESIPKEGRILHHGDVVHFGQLTFRFVLSKPGQIPRPTITPD